MHIHIRYIPQPISLAKGNPNDHDCALLCDGMNIKSSTIYNKFTGLYEGFANYEKNIVAFDEDVVAKEALVFVLVGLRSHRKYSIAFCMTI